MLAGQLPLGSMGAPGGPAGAPGGAGGVSSPLGGTRPIGSAAGTASVLSKGVSSDPKTGAIRVDVVDSDLPQDQPRVSVGIHPPRNPLGDFMGYVAGADESRKTLFAKAAKLLDKKYSEVWPKCRVLLTTTVRDGLEPFDDPAMIASVNVIDPSSKNRPTPLPPASSFADVTYEDGPLTVTVNSGSPVDAIFIKELNEISKQREELARDTTNQVVERLWRLCEAINARVRDTMNSAIHGVIQLSRTEKVYELPVKTKPKKEGGNMASGQEKSAGHNRESKSHSRASMPHASRGKRGPSRGMASGRSTLGKSSKGQVHSHGKVSEPSPAQQRASSHQGTKQHADTRLSHIPFNLPFSLMENPMVQAFVTEVPRRCEEIKQYFPHVDLTRFGFPCGSLTEGSEGEPGQGTQDRQEANDVSEESEDASDFQDLPFRVSGSIAKHDQGQSNFPGQTNYSEQNGQVPTAVKVSMIDISALVHPLDDFADGNPWKEESLAYIFDLKNSVHSDTRESAGGSLSGLGARRSIESVHPPDPDVFPTVASAIQDFETRWDNSEGVIASRGLAMAARLARDSDRLVRDLLATAVSTILEKYKGVINLTSSLDLVPDVKRVNENSDEHHTKTAREIHKSPSHDFSSIGSKITPVSPIAVVPAPTDPVDAVPAPLETLGGPPMSQNVDSSTLSSAIPAAPSAIPSASSRPPIVTELKPMESSVDRLPDDFLSNLWTARKLDSDENGISDAPNSSAQLG